MKDPKLLSYETPIPMKQFTDLSRSEVLDQFHKLEDLEYKFHNELRSRQKELADPLFARVRATPIATPLGETKSLVIASATPSNETTADFWRLVHQEKIGMIVTFVEQFTGGSGWWALP